MHSNKHIQLKPEVLKSAREASGHTQESLCNLIRLEVRSLKKIEKSGRTSIRTATQIAEVLDTELEVLIGEEKFPLSNFWMQTAYGENKFREPGKLFQTDLEMLSSIRTEIDACLFIEPDFSQVTTAQVQSDETFTTIKFESNNKNLQAISYRYSKTLIRDGVGIQTAKLTKSEREILDFDLHQLLSDTTVSYQINGEDIGQNAYFKARFYRRRSGTPDAAPELLEERDFKNLYTGLSIFNVFALEINPLFPPFTTTLGEFAQITCLNPDGYDLGVAIGRYYRNGNGNEKTAPFPTTWKSRFKIFPEYKHDPEQPPASTFSLAEFEDYELPRPLSVD